MKIIHLACLHDLPDKSASEVRVKKPRLFEEVARSQFVAARYISENPNNPVLQEGAIDTIYQSNLSEVDILTKIYFPNGLPDSYGELTSEQKEHLYEFGGARIMFGLGVIPAIYKSIHESVGETFNKKVERKLAKGKDYEKIDYVVIKREKEAIECAKEAAIEHYGNTKDAEVIVVFGRAHNFKPFCYEQSIEHSREETDREEPKDLKYDEKKFSLQTSHKNKSDKIQSIDIGKYKLRLTPGKYCDELRLFSTEVQVAYSNISHSYSIELQNLIKEKNIELLIEKLKDWDYDSLEMAKMLQEEKKLPEKTAPTQHTSDKITFIEVGKYNLQLKLTNDDNSELILFTHGKEIERLRRLSTKISLEIAALIEENNNDGIISRLEKMGITSTKIANRLKEKQELPTISGIQKGIFGKERALKEENKDGNSKKTAPTQHTSDKITFIEIGKYNLQLKLTNDDNSELILFVHGKEIERLRRLSTKISLEIAALIEENNNDGIISRLEKMGVTSTKIADRLKEKQELPTISGIQKGIFGKERALKEENKDGSSKMHSSSKKTDNKLNTVKSHKQSIEPEASADIKSQDIFQGAGKSK